jgi:tetratricopeptide (TPR) repeat protein
MRDDNPINRDALTALIAGVALAVLTLLVYCPCFDHPFCTLDDPDYVTENRHVQAGLTADSVRWACTSFEHSNWHPLTWVSLQLDAQLFGGHNAGAFHRTNVVLHTANTLLLFLVLGGMTGRVWRSAVVAALFALHPLHVESVAWVAERKDVLSTLFWMLALAAYLSYVRRPGLGRYLLVALALGLGLLAKPMLVTLPCVLLLLDYWPLKRVARGQRLVTSKENGTPTLATLLLEKVPLFALVLASCLLTFLAQSRGEAVRSLQTYPLDVRVWNALLACTGYLDKMLRPVYLAVYYPHPGSAVAVGHALGAGLLLAVLTALVLGPGRRWPYLAVGWLWYLGTLVPVVGLVQVGGQAMADRYTYVPLVGLFLLLTWGAADLAAAWRVPPPYLAGTAALVLSACVALTWVQVGYWSSYESLWKHAIAVTEKNVMAHCHLAECYAERARPDDARREYARAVAVDPRLPGPHNALGNTLRDLGRRQEARAEYRQAIDLDPAFVLAHYNLGLVLAELGQEEEALAEFHQTIALEPDHVLAHCHLGACYSQQGRTDAARKEFETVVALDPRLAQPHEALGNLLGDLGRLDEAVAEYRQALQLAPGRVQTHYHLGLVLQEQGQLEEALAEYRKALDQGYPPARPRLQACERLGALRRRLPGLLAGRDQPADPSEGLAFADLCRQRAQRRYALAARLYAAAFAVDSRLADDWQAAHRSHAASAAALAGCGQGADAAHLDDPEKARLRSQARTWLGADLTRWGEQAAAAAEDLPATVRQRLARWQQDPDLAGVRDTAALAKLPAAERQAWQQLWQEVDAGLARTSANR